MPDNYNNLTKEEWQHAFADSFFDQWVEHEIRTFGQRVLNEDSIYEVAYDNAVAASEDDWLWLPPDSAAFVIIDRLIEDSKNV